MSARQATGHSEKEGTPLEDAVAGRIGLQPDFIQYQDVYFCAVLQGVVPPL